MADKRTYKVIGGCALVKIAGTVVTLSQDAIVPDEVTAEQVKHLISVGVVGPVDAPFSALTTGPATVQNGSSPQAPAK